MGDSLVNQSHIEKSCETNLVQNVKLFDCDYGQEDLPVSNVILNHSDDSEFLSSKLCEISIGVQGDQSVFDPSLCQNLSSGTPDLTVSCLDQDDSNVVDIFRCGSQFSGCVVEAKRDHLVFDQSLNNCYHSHKVFHNNCCVSQGVYHPVFEKTLGDSVLDGELFSVLGDHTVSDQSLLLSQDVPISDSEAGLGDHTVSDQSLTVCPSVPSVKMCPVLGDHTIYDQSCSSFSNKNQLVSHLDFEKFKDLWPYPVQHKSKCDLCSVCEVSETELPLFALHQFIWNSRLPNYLGCRIPTVSNLNIPFWRSELVDYFDKELCDLLNFGFPIGLVNENQALVDLHVKCKNHSGATEFPDEIWSYLQEERAAGAILGPLISNPFDHKIVISPLNSVEKKDSVDRRVILDLSWPWEKGVNSFIPKDEYLGQNIVLKFPTVDALVEIVVSKGSGCLMFKKDLKRAYRQIPVDPKDWSFFLRL